MLAVSGSASTAVRDCAQRLRDALKFVQLASVAKGPRLAMLTTAPLSPALGSHARRQRRRLSRRCMACSVGVVLVDHGSRKAESNDMLVHLVSLYKQHTQRRIVHHAHMELARGRGRLSRLQLCVATPLTVLPVSATTTQATPSIADAFDACVGDGATTVVVSPYFLSPGRHWQEDIPQLTAAAAAKHPGVKYLVSAPLGLHPLIAEVLESRVRHCLEHASRKFPACEVCTLAGVSCSMHTAQALQQQ